jgi:hypothetical protein
MSRLRTIRWRKIYSVVIVATIALVVVGFVFFLSPNPYLWGVVGHPEYCEHFVTEARGIRLGITPIASREPVEGRQVDPNNWRGDHFAFDYLAHSIIWIPYVEYEVTQDGGASWERFWRYDNQINEYPWCSAFSSLDSDHFWVWSRNWIAVTHDGGYTWLVHNGNEEWGTRGSHVIDYVEFDTPTRGRIEFLYWTNKTGPTLLTDDGGQTWLVDPGWTPPGE